tara:strand:+ start:271 stop:894 length:624 start_codon:yes stop_codon:yes gene_type:complete
MNPSLEILKKSYSTKGTVYIDKEDFIFDEIEMSKIVEYCNSVEKEFITVGDADELNHVHVGRFMTDVKKPEIVKNDFSNPLLRILGSKKVLSLIKSIINTEDDIHLRRVQYNEITENCFVGYHLDTDSNPDYLAACVIQLGHSFEGGLYRVYNKVNKNLFNDFKSDFGSLIISDCNFPHEVTKVTKGKRGSLVFFVSKNSGLNKKNI